MFKTDRFFQVAALTFFATAAMAQSTAQSHAKLDIVFTGLGPDINAISGGTIFLSGQDISDPAQFADSGNDGGFQPTTLSIDVYAFGLSMSFPNGFASAAAETDNPISWENAGTQGEFVNYNWQATLDAAALVTDPGNDNAHAVSQVGLFNADTGSLVWNEFAIPNVGSSTSEDLSGSGTIFVPANSRINTTFFAYSFTTTNSTSAPSPTAALSFGLAALAGSRRLKRRRSKSPDRR